MSIIICKNYGKSLVTEEVQNETIEGEETNINFTNKWHFSTPGMIYFKYFDRISRIKRQGWSLKIQRIQLECIYRINQFA